MIKLKQLFDSYIDENNYDYALYNQIEKELKALEIIKEKKVNIAYFLEFVDEFRGHSYEDYLDLRIRNGIVYNISREILTQEEYDLLKETLCNTLKT